MTSTTHLIHTSRNDSSTIDLPSKSVLIHSYEFMSRPLHPSSLLVVVQTTSWRQTTKMETPREMWISTPQEQSLTVMKFKLQTPSVIFIRTSRSTSRIRKHLLVNTSLPCLQTLVIVMYVTRRFITYVILDMSVRSVTFMSILNAWKLQFMERNHWRRIRTFLVVTTTFDTSMWVPSILSSMQVQVWSQSRTLLWSFAPVCLWIDSPPWTPW